MPLEGSRERITYIQPHDIISKGKHYLHSEVGQIMTTKLERISELSKQHPEMKFSFYVNEVNMGYKKNFKKGITTNYFIYGFTFSKFKVFWIK